MQAAYLFDLGENKLTCFMIDGRLMSLSAARHAIDGMRYAPGINGWLRQHAIHNSDCHAFYSY